METEETVKFIVVLTFLAILKIYNKKNSGRRKIVSLLHLEWLDVVMNYSDVDELARNIYMIHVKNSYNNNNHMRIEQWKNKYQYERETNIWTK